VGRRVDQAHVTIPHDPLAQVTLPNAGAGGVPVYSSSRVEPMNETPSRRSSRPTFVRDASELQASFEPGDVPSHVDLATTF
jgi:hypothetical protein